MFEKGKGKKFLEDIINFVSSAFGLIFCTFQFWSLFHWNNGIKVY